MRISDWSSDVCSSDLCRRKVRLANGRELSALDIQTEYLNKALKYAETKDLTPQEKQALQMWEHCVSTIERDPMDLDREVDWVIKHKLIEGYRAKHDLPLTDPKIALLDLQYQDRKSTRLNSITNAHLVCRLLLEKKNNTQ